MVVDSHIGIYASMRMNDLQLHKPIPKYLILIMNENPSYKGVLQLYKLHNRQRSDVGSQDGDHPQESTGIMTRSTSMSSEVLVIFCFHLGAIYTCMFYL